MTFWKSRFGQWMLDTLALWSVEASIVRVETAFQTLTAERDALRAAIVEHHAQKADDRCIEDDDRLYAAAGLPPCDRRVGDKDAMLRNCARFIERRCQSGGWPTYAALEAKVQLLTDLLQRHHNDRSESRIVLPHPRDGIGPIDLGESYAASALYNETSAALRPA